MSDDWQTVGRNGRVVHPPRVKESVVKAFPRDAAFRALKDAVPAEELRCLKTHRCQTDDCMAFKDSGHHERPVGYDGHMWILRGNPEDWHDYEASAEENEQGHQNYLNGGGMICMECNEAEDWPGHAYSKAYQVYGGLRGLGGKLRAWHDAGEWVEGTMAKAWMDEDGRLHTNVYGRAPHVPLQTFTGRCQASKTLGVPDHTLVGEFYSQREADNAAWRAAEAVAHRLRETRRNWRALIRGLQYPDETPSTLSELRKVLRPAKGAPEPWRGPWHKEEPIPDSGASDFVTLAPAPGGRWVVRKLEHADLPTGWLWCGDGRWSNNTPSMSCPGGGPRCFGVIEW